MAWSTWAAAGGMLVIGFVVAFAGVGNPRLVGLASAFQLFYILASFPPYQPGTLPQRLGGVTFAIVLLAAAEVVLWPDPVPVSYRQRLTQAADGVAALLDATADGLTHPHAGPGDRDARRERAYDVVAAIELGRNPPEWAPTAAGVQDRALRICAAALREVLVEADRLVTDAPPEPAGDLAAAGLLRSCADTTRAAGRSLAPGAPAVFIDGLDTAVGRAETAYPVGEGDGRDTSDVPRLCRDATALALADQVRVFAVGARVATGARLHGEDATSDCPAPQVTGMSVGGCVRRAAWATSASRDPTPPVAGAVDCRTQWTSLPEWGPQPKSTPRRTFQNLPYAARLDSATPRRRPASARQVDQVRARGGCG